MLPTCMQFVHPLDISTRGSELIRRLGMPVTLTQLNELNELHVFIRPIFMETVVLNGIVTRQHQGRERMSTYFCTHIVVSKAKVSHMDRLRLGAEFADYVLFLD